MLHNKSRKNFYLNFLAKVFDTVSNPGPWVSRTNVVGWWILEKHLSSTRITTVVMQRSTQCGYQLQVKMNPPLSVTSPAPGVLALHWHGGGQPVQTWVSSWYVPCWAAGLQPINVPGSDRAVQHTGATWDPVPDSLTSCFRVLSTLKHWALRFCTQLYWEHTAHTMPNTSERCLLNVQHLLCFRWATIWLGKTRLSGVVSEPL